MARQCPVPRSGLFAAAAAGVALLAAWTAPAFAATNSTTLCEQLALATLDVPDIALKSRVVNHDAEPAEQSAIANVEALSPQHLLAPGVEAALRRVFSEEIPRDEEAIESASAPLAETQPEADTLNRPLPETEPAPMNTRVPGVSDDDLVNFKQQMYRKDI